MRRWSAHAQKRHCSCTRRGPGLSGQPGRQHARGRALDGVPPPERQHEADFELLEGHGGVSPAEAAMIPTKIPPKANRRPGIAGADMKRFERPRLEANSRKTDTKKPPREIPGGYGTWKYGCGGRI